MNKKLEIPISDFCNMIELENDLKAYYKISMSKNEVTFSFNELKWIGPLQVSLIYEWILALINKEIIVNIDISNSKLSTDAIDFLSRINFFYELRELGAIILKSPNESSSSKLAAFKKFKNKNELNTYEISLEDNESVNLLLGRSAGIDLISDGDLKEIIIHELGQNAFIHGKGINVRYSVGEFPFSRSRKNHKVLSSFNGSSYIETVVSDSGPGLIKTLENILPEDYEPEEKLKFRRLTKEAAVVAFAFEFSSTSDEEGRKKRLEEILSKAKDSTDAVPTGLFYVGSLAKLYGGQLIVRTGRSLISLDYSKSSDIVLYSRSNLITITGTHILVRVPRNRKRIIPKLWPKLQNYPPLSNKSVSYLTLEDTTAQNNSEAAEADFLVQAEKKIIQTYVAASKQVAAPVVVLCDGIHLDTKTFSIFLILLAFIPRRSCSLLVMGVRDELFEVAKKQWQMISKMRSNTKFRMNRLQGYKSFILVNKNCMDVFAFGDESHSDATTFITDQKQTNRYEYNIEKLMSYYFFSIKEQLKYMIEKKPVKHHDKYYLIESKYYTPSFYEIGKLVYNRLGAELSLSFIKIVLQQNDIGCVFIVSEPLYDFADSLQENLTDVVWIKRDIDNERSSFMRALLSLDDGKKLLILSDVICSGSEINKFLSLVFDFDKLLIACFVDGRLENLPYFIVKREEKAHSVKVISLHSDPISPIYDLTDDDVTNILIIDPKTHAPTSYDHIKKPELSVEQLLNICQEHDSLYYGHLNFHGKHYSSFLYFAKLFNNITINLKEWWDSTIQRFIKKRIKLEDITVHYLDEKRGYERIIVNYFSTKGLGKLEALKREDLIAPPAEPSEIKNNIWFILPAMASGNTAIRCLEYASRYNVNEIYISIIVSRVDFSKFSFYQNITGYRNCSNVKIDTLSCLPVPVYPSISLCPQCTIFKLIDELIRKVSGFEYFNAIVDTAKEIFTLREIVLDQLDANHPNVANPDDYKRILMRIYYEEAPRNVELRKSLTSMLYVQGMSKLFFEMVGLEFISASFSKLIFKKIIYGQHYEYLFAEAKNILNSSDKIQISLKCMLGIHSLFPDLLLEKIKHVFLTAFDNTIKSTCNSLLFLALLEPEKYGLTLASIDNLVDKSVAWKTSLIKDIRSFPYWHESEFSYSVNDFLELLWLLRRSTPWGSNIENLRAVIQAPDCSIKDVKKAFSVFESGGVKKTLHHVNQLRNREKRKPGNLWGALLSEENNIEETIDRIESTNSIMNELAGLGDVESRDSLLIATKKIDNLGKQLVNSLQKLFSNPLDVRMKINEISSTRWPNSIINIRFIIAEDQPGILISLEDLLQSVGHIIDNANDCINHLSKDNYLPTQNLWIDFSFNGYTSDKCGSVMVIRDNIPWPDKIYPSGGMKQFVKLCKKYAAVYSFTPNEPDENLRIYVIYKIDDKRERHEQY